MGNGHAGLANLRRFVAYTAAATGELETLADRMGSQETRFATLAAAVAEERKEFVDAVREAHDEIGLEVEAIEEALQRVAQAAMTGQSEVEEAVAALERAASAVSREAETAAARAGVSEARLGAEGFGPLDVRSDTESAELASATDALDRSLDGLEGSVEEAQAGAAASFAEVTKQMEDTIAAQQADRRASVADLGEGVTTLDAAGDAFEPACTQVATDVDALHEALETASADQEGEWRETVSEVAQDVAAFAAEAAEERLAAPLRIVETQALDALEREYASLGTALDDGAALAGELTPVTEELAACLQVVARVAELLDALAQ